MDIYTVLMILAGIIGLLITGSAVFTAWLVLRLIRMEKEAKQEGTAEAASVSKQSLPASFSSFLRWTVLDYGLLALFAIGGLFLAADVVAVYRDRALYTYPYWHMGYLMMGTAMVLLAMLFLLARFFLVLRLAGTPRVATSNHHDEPHHAHHAE